MNNQYTNLNLQGGVGALPGALPGAPAAIQYEVLPPSQTGVQPGAAKLPPPFPAGHYAQAPASGGAAVQPELQIQYEQLPSTESGGDAAGKDQLAAGGADALLQWQAEAFGGVSSPENVGYGASVPPYGGAGGAAGGSGSHYHPAQAVTRHAQQQKLPAARQYDVAGPEPTVSAAAEPSRARPLSPRAASSVQPSLLSRARCCWCELYPPVGKVKFQERYLRLCSPCIDTVKADRSVATKIVNKLKMWESGSRLLCEQCGQNSAYCKAQMPDGLLKKVCGPCLGTHADFLRSLQHAEMMVAERQRLNEAHTTLLELNTMSAGHHRVLIALCRCELLLYSIESAFERLHEALAACFSDLQSLHDDPVYAPLRQLPGFAPLVAKHAEILARLTGEAPATKKASATVRHHKAQSLPVQQQHASTLHRMGSVGVGVGGGSQQPAQQQTSPRDFRQAPYYNATMDRAGAEQYLQPQKAGTFVVRPCSVPGHVSLSHKKPQKAGGGVGHCMVKIHERGGFSVENATETFGTMDDLLRSLPGVDFRSFELR